MERSRQNLIDGLREAATFLEEHPDLQVSYSDYDRINATVFADGPEELAAVARQLGTCEKDGSDDFYRVTRKVGPVSFGAFATRAKVCKRKVIGHTTVEVPIMERVGAETKRREIVEWECDPLLADHAG